MELYAVDITALGQPDHFGVNVDWWIEGIFLPIVALIGIFGMIHFTNKIFSIKTRQ